MSAIRKSRAVVRCAIPWLCVAAALPAQTLTTIHSFNGTDGKLPFAALAQATDGNLYGTTYYGGANSSGNVFKVNPAGTLKTAYSLCSQSDCADGEYTYAVPVQGTDGAGLCQGGSDGQDSRHQSHWRDPRHLQR